MSFTKTISIFAALASIFAAGVTGWKLADSQRDAPLTSLDQKVLELEKKLEEVTKQPVQQVVQPPVTPPPPPVILPEVTPPPPVPTEE